MKWREVARLTAERALDEQLCVIWNNLAADFTVNKGDEAGAMARARDGLDVARRAYSAALELAAKLPEGEA